jgi:hypothetical protein
MEDKVHIRFAEEVFSGPHSPMLVDRKRRKRRRGESPLTFRCTVRVDYMETPVVIEKDVTVEEALGAAVDKAKRASGFDVKGVEEIILPDLTRRTANDIDPDAEARLLEGAMIIVKPVQAESSIASIIEAKVKSEVAASMAPYESRLKAMSSEVSSLRQRVDYITYRALFDEARSRAFERLGLPWSKRDGVLLKPENLHKLGTLGLATEDVRLVLGNGGLRERGNEAAHEFGWMEIAKVVARADEDVKPNLRRLFLFCYGG